MAMNFSFQIKVTISQILILILKGTFQCLQILWEIMF